MKIMTEIKNVFRKKEALGIILSIPQTLWFNFMYLPLGQAVKLPVWLHYKCKYNICKESLKLRGNVRPAMIRCGFSIDYAKSFSDMTYLRIEKGALCIFAGTAHLGRGTKISVHKGALLEIGNNFAISASSTIKCFRHIKFGSDILFAWDCLVMDSDGHSLYDNNGNKMNEDKEILFGDKVWIGCCATILKGVVIPTNCVIGANSMITRGEFFPNSVIAGNPPVSKKEINNWSI